VKEDTYYKVEFTSTHSTDGAIVVRIKGGVANAKKHLLSVLDEAVTQVVGRMHGKIHENGDSFQAFTVTPEDMKIPHSVTCDITLNDPPKILHRDRVRARDGYEYTLSGIQDVTTQSRIAEKSGASPVGMEVWLNLKKGTITDLYDQTVAVNYRGMLFNCKLSCEPVRKGKSLLRVEIDCHTKAIAKTVMGSLAVGRVEVGGKFNTTALDIKFIEKILKGVV